ncbi:MAG: glycosyltransferase family 39 protein [Minicystis sp.]
MGNEAMTWCRRAAARAGWVRSHLSLAALLLVAGYAGLVGIDFGSHWDEPTMLRVVGDALTRGELLPRWYNYPSVSFDLSLLGGASEVLSMSVLPSLRGSAGGTGALAALVGSRGFLLRTRAIFLLVSLLAVVWVYWLAWDRSKSRLEATLAGGLVAFSWEIGYHARWVAPDAVMMQFGALSLLCMHLALSRRSARWSWAAAGAAGLACGTKYPGGALLLPVCLCAAIVAHERRRGAVGILRCASGALAAFVVAYLVTTPGTVLEYARFFTDVRREYAHYHDQGHPGGHSIRAGLPHLRAACEYLFCAALSRYPIIAEACSALAVIGAAALVREGKGRALALLAFPVLYVGYMSSQRVMVVRNLLVVIPFLALFAARGGAMAVRAAGRLRGGRLLVTTLLAAMLTSNAIWLVWAARTVARDEDPTRALGAYLGDHAEQRFLVTPRVERALKARHATLPSNIVAHAEGRSEVVLFYASEAIASNKLVAFHHDTALRWFGGYEVNYNYYPTWAGRNRIVAMALPTARALFPRLWAARETAGSVEPSGWGPPG